MTHPFAWMDSRLWNPDDPADMAELAEAERQRQEYDARRPNGGPAFPVAADGAYIPDCDDPSQPPAREYPGHSGMTLRDWFAGQALVTIAQGGGSREALVRVIDRGEYGDVNDIMAKTAYALADAMLAERAK